MAIDLDVSHAPAQVLIRIRSEWPSTSDQLDLFAELQQQKQLNASSRVLFDLRDAALPAIKATGPRTVRSGGSTLSAVARGYLVQSEEQLGFVTHLRNWSPPGTQINVFTDEIAARRWLRARSPVAKGSSTAPLM